MKVTASLAFLCTIWFAACNSDSAGIKPEKRDWVESIYASSKVEAYQQFEQRAEVSGRLIGYWVKEGDIVEAGDLIAKIDGLSMDTRVKIAQYQLEQLQASRGRIAELHKQMQSIHAVFTQDSIDYNRQLRLQKSGIGSQSQLEMRALKLQQSTSQRQSMEQSIQTISGEIKAQQKQLEQQLALAQEQQNAYNIYAFRSGKIYELPASVGELLTPQQPIALIGDTAKFLVNLEIDERDIARIKLGQEVVVKLDAYEETFRAQISHISKRLDPQTQTFHTEAIFYGNHPTFYPGLTAESNIIIQEKKGVMAIPITAVQAGNLVVTSQGEKTIRVGLKNTQWVEVLSGLEWDSEIILPNESK